MGSVPFCRAFQIDCKGGRFNLTPASESQSSTHLLQFWTTIRVDLPRCCAEDMLMQSSLNYIILWWSHLAILKWGLTCKIQWHLLPKNDVKLGWDIINVVMKARERIVAGSHQHNPSLVISLGKLLASAFSTQVQCARKCGRHNSEILQQVWGRTHTTW
jgi:hypothetical protein